jgi:S1-C subfamily serine protease
VAPALFVASLATWRAGYGLAPGAHEHGALHSAVVKLSIKVPPDARTARTLGTEREGTGVIIDETGLIVTIGYLIMESSSILVIAHDGTVHPAHLIGFDHVTGFGVVRANPTIARRPIALGPSSEVHELQALKTVTHPAAGGLAAACVVGRRSFTGYWEYMLDDAIFAAPARADHSGAALIDAAGRLVGIGSLWVADVLDLGVAFPGNMFVPTDLLKPVLPDLIATGRRRGPGRPWLGLYSEEVQGHVVIAQVLPDSPAQRAGLQRGDLIISVGGDAVSAQADFYRKLWESGDAGTSIVLHVLRKRIVREVSVHSIDRLDYLRPRVVS